MRVLLDVHPSIRCGPETVILPLLLKLHATQIAPLQDHRLPLASINKTTIDAIYTNIISTLLVKTGEKAERLCVKDPLIDNYLPYLLEIYPRAKFVLLVRDGRASVSSIMK